MQLNTRFRSMTAQKSDQTRSLQVLGTSVRVVYMSFKHGIYIFTVVLHTLNYF